jgi:hypothetical protein
MTSRRRAAVIAASLLAAHSACGGGSTPTPAAPPVDSGTCTMTESAVANEGWLHVSEGSPVTYRANPPASGPHYPVWLRYQAYTSAQARPYWVHNLEHGAIVLAHRPDAPASVVQLLGDTFRSLPTDGQCGHARALLTPDPQLPRAVAVIAANFVLEGDCVSPARIQQFTLDHRGRGPENICDQGTRP